MYYILNMPVYEKGYEDPVLFVEEKKSLNNKKQRSEENLW